ncbi:MAG: DUF3995 domain-containing protein [Pseudonocardia sp.]|nr:DUF3995 domain-containing protein [Pseudonocardia sp.]
MLSAMRCAVVVDAAALLAVGALHASWALGSPWPAPDMTTLARRVVGGDEMPPPPLTAGVAVLLGGAAGALLVREGVLGEPVARLASRPGLRRLVIAGCLATAGALLGRVIGGLVAHARVVDPGTAEFGSSDMRVYAPMCLALGAVAAMALRPQRPPGAAPAARRLPAC